MSEVNESIVQGEQDELAKLDLQVYSDPDYKSVTGRHKYVRENMKLHEADEDAFRIAYDDKADSIEVYRKRCDCAMRMAESAIRGALKRQSNYAEWVAAPNKQPAHSVIFAFDEVGNYLPFVRSLLSRRAYTKLAETFKFQFIELVFCGTGTDVFGHDKELRPSTDPGRFKFVVVEPVNDVADYSTIARKLLAWK